MYQGLTRLCARRSTQSLDQEDSACTDKNDLCMGTVQLLVEDFFGAVHSKSRVAEVGDRVVHGPALA